MYKNELEINLSEGKDGEKKKREREREREKGKRNNKQSMVDGCQGIETFVHVI